MALPTPRALFVWQLALLALSLAAATTTATVTPPCNVTGTWQSVGGAPDAITVVEGMDATFVASAASGFKNAPGRVYANNTLFLDCCKAGGITGTMNAGCSRIAWADGVGSRWQRPVLKNVTISNVAPRVDDTGAILRVQDGCLAIFDGTFYLYGARYQCCTVDEQPGCYQPCGWRNATFAVYSSPDLTTWHLENDNLMPIMTVEGSPHSNTLNAYFEPCVLYSPSADHYALWFLNTNTKAVAVSDSPIGPFESVTWDTGISQGSDSYFWVDEADGATYVKHNGPPPPGSNLGSHYVSRLAPDLLSVAANATSGAMSVPALPVPPYFQGSWPECSEGGGMFSHGGRWFVMAGACCCFCAGGANAYVWASDAPLGPYTLQSDTGVMPWNATQGRYMSGAQQFSVAALPTSSGELPIYIG